MSKTVIFMTSCAGIVAMSGCALDSSSAATEQTDGEQAHVAEADTAAASPDFAPGGFHTIRLANTQLCLQPQGASLSDVPIELAPCRFTANEQNWLMTPVSGGTELINQKSAKCVYNAGSSPPVNGTGPVLQTACRIGSTNTPASNVLWQPSSPTNLSTLTTLIGHHNTGFCLDVPGGNAFPGATLQIFQCNNTGSQAWIVGVE